MVIPLSLASSHSGERVMIRFLKTKDDVEQAEFKKREKKKKNKTHRHVHIRELRTNRLTLGSHHPIKRAQEND